MEAEEEPTDTMKGQISKEIKQTGDVELNLLGKESLVFLCLFWLCVLLAV